MRLPEIPGAATLLAGMLLLAHAAVAQQQAKWDRGADSDVAYANITSPSGDYVSFYCRETKAGHVGGMILRTPMFTTRVRDKAEYSLNVVTGGARDSMTVIGKDIDLWYEASDLNQKLLLAAIVERLKTSDRLDLAVSSLGWRAAYRYEGAGAALAGVMDPCL